MEIDNKYLKKYLHNIATDQIADEYTRKGYIVSKEISIGEYSADLIAKKGDETIVIEIKADKLTPKERERLKQLNDYVRSQDNYKFLIVVASLPKEKKLEILDIETLLESEINNDLPSELVELSSHTRVEQVFDVEVYEISIEGDSIFVKGDGVVSVELQYGSDSDYANGDGHRVEDTFPFDFEITLGYDDNKKKLVIVEVSKLEVDTTSYYDI